MFLRNFWYVAAYAMKSGASHWGGWFSASPSCFTDPKMKARFADLGGTVLSGSPADFGKLIADETSKWGKVIRAANIKAQ